MLRNLFQAASNPRILSNAFGAVAAGAMAGVEFGNRFGQPVIGGVIGAALTTVSCVLDPGAFVGGAYRRLRVGPYRVLYEIEGNLITIVRIDRV